MDSRQRALRTYRTMSPSRFHVFNQKVRAGLVRVWAVILAVNPGLRAAYEDASEKHDTAFHEALLGSILQKRRRDDLQAQIIVYLDEIALILESAAFRDPEVLVLSAFDLAKERRGRPRVKAALTASAGASTVEQHATDQGTS